MHNSRLQVTELSNLRARSRRRAHVMLGAVLVTTAAVTLAGPVDAFKPYTHNETARHAYEDVVDDGNVTINDVEYPVRTELVQALQNQPAAYNAGVIGPDGFPDLGYGQSQIHPEETGQWLEYLYEGAWAAYADPSRSQVDKEQILAFTYGFMTHAAGEMWAHTLMNKVSDGVFPSVGDILGGDVAAAEIALRHTIAEAYIGDATPGYDGNPDRSAVPGEVNEDGDPDYSDDATPRYQYTAPTEWIYDMLVDPHTPLPVGTCDDGIDDDGDGATDDGCPGGPFTVGDPEPLRGPVVDFFLDLQADLEVEAARLEYDGDFTDCNIIDPDCYALDHSITVHTVRGTKQATVGVQECIGATIGCLVSPIDAGDDIIVNSIGASYMQAWIEDIEAGLQEWPELGLQLSKALFDAGTYRDAQNFACRNELDDGLEENGDRESCEDGVGITDVIMYTLGGVNGDGGPSGFVPEHLLAMVGAPDFVGDGFEFLGDALTWLEDIIASVMPDIDIFDDLVADIEEKITELVSEALGFDVKLLETFLKSPTHWMEVEQATFDLPFLGSQTVNLFEEGDREYLDGVMGLLDPVISEEVELPGGDTVPSVRLKDEAEWTYEDFEPAYDAVVMSKLLLLDGAQLNQVIKNGIGISIHPSAEVATYTDVPGRPANVMLDALDGGDPWLLSIDSDHAWRADRLPTFTGPDGEHGYGGRGQFPLWESCLARPVFRQLFRDWENGEWQVAGNNFPDHGDQPSNDPTVSSAPTATFTITGSQAVVDGIQWVGGDHGFTLDASDAIYTDSALTIRHRAYPVGTTAPEWTIVSGAEATFDLGADAADGAWTIEWEVASPCRTTTGSAAVSLDTAAPEIVIVEPAADQYDTDDLTKVEYTTSDSGSGVASHSVTFDGGAATNGQVIDMFSLLTGTHEVAVSAADYVGNSSSANRSFILLATAESLRNNIDRAVNEGLITNPGARNGLAASLDSAKASHDAGHHSVEANQLSAVLNQTAAKRGNGIDAPFADRLTGWVNDLIQSGN